jgi:hypothetical protein
MTTLGTSQSLDHRTHAAEYRHYAYMTDGWNPVRRWDGRTGSLVNAGIVGPSQVKDSWTPNPVLGVGGSLNAGVHWFRYRYMDSTTGYVSNPSEAVQIMVGADGNTLTFAVGASGAANIIRSTDAKVDTIVLEMSPSDGTKPVYVPPPTGNLSSLSPSYIAGLALTPQTTGEPLYYEVGRFLQISTTIVASISDAELTQKLLQWPESGNDVPPITKYVYSYRNRLWAFGAVVHEAGTVNISPLTNVVNGTGTRWSTAALGAVTGAGAVITAPSQKWYLHVEGNDNAREIKGAVNSTQLILHSAIGGTYRGFGVATGPYNYKIYSRLDAIWVSNPENPEAFSPTNFIQGPTGTGAEGVTAGIGYAGTMLFYGKQTMWKLSWDVDPLQDPSIMQLSDKYGAISQRVVLEIEGVVYSLDRKGFQAFAGTFPKHISNKVDALLSNIDWTKEERFHAVFYPELRAIRWFVVYDGDEYPQNYFQYDIDTGDWGTGETLTGISESALVPTADGLKVYVGDENGHVWIDNLGTCDGCHEKFSHVTAAAGCTTSIIVVDEDLQNPSEDSAGLAGCILTQVEANGIRYDRVIRASSHNSITVDSLPSAPSDGDELWIGRIPARLRTKDFVAVRGGPRRRRSPIFLWIYWKRNQTGSRNFLVKFYENFSTDPREYSTVGAADASVALPGLEAPYAVTKYSPYDWRVDSTHTPGVVRIPIALDWVQAISARLEIDEPDTDIEIYGMVIEGLSADMVL